MSQSNILSPQRFLRHPLFKMKFSLFIGLLAITACCAPTVHAQQAGAAGITVVVEGYELSKKDAAAILNTHELRLDAAVLFKQAVRAGAKVVKLGTLKTTSGSRAVAREKGKPQVEVECVVGSDGQFVDINIAVEHGLRKMVTNCTTSLGGVCYLGAMDDSKKDVAELVFVRITRP